MIYLELFLTFLKIGVVSFGGGYGMIALIRESVLTNGWLTEDALINFIAVAESTPGPIAVNMATFIGSSQAGILGALVATLGVVLPSFIIILIIASLIKNLLKYAGVKATLEAIRPAIVGLILATAFTMLMSVMFGISTAESHGCVDWRGILIFAVMALVSILYSRSGDEKRGAFTGNTPSAKIKITRVSPILIFVLAGLLGLLLYPFLKTQKKTRRMRRFFLIGFVFGGRTPIVRDNYLNSTLDQVCPTAAPRKPQPVPLSLFSTVKDVVFPASVETVISPVSAFQLSVT